MIAPINNWPASTLAKSFSYDELSEIISYLQLALDGEVIPGAELYRLGIDALNYTNEELQAVQNKVALAISHQKKNKVA